MRPPTARHLAAEVSAAVKKTAPLLLAIILALGAPGWVGTPPAAAAAPNLTAHAVLRAEQAPPLPTSTPVTTSSRPADHEESSGVNVGTVVFIGMCLFIAAGALLLVRSSRRARSHR